MEKKKRVAVLLIGAALLMIGGGILLMATMQKPTGGSANSSNGYQLTVTGPWGTVYPYSDKVKSYLMTEGTDAYQYFAEGTAADGDTSFKPVCITWRDTENAAITKYVVQYGTKADLSDAITVTKDTQLSDKKIEVYNLYKASTYYVRVTAYSAETVMGQGDFSFQTSDMGPRVMKIDSLYNVRDIGGYFAEDGKKTRQGMVYRGCEMDANGVVLSAEGNAYMSNVLGIKVDLDLRGNGSQSPITFARKEAIGIGGYLEAFSQAEQYRKIFATLADENNYPVYIHCAGGADRTGTVCYLLGALLGVPEEFLIQDYEMTSYSMYGSRTRDSDVYDFPAFVEKLKSYQGNTLTEKTESYMRSIGVTEGEIQNIRNILLQEAAQSSELSQDLTNISTGALPEELSGEEPKHIFDFSNWSGDDYTIGFLGEVKEDPASQVGTAAVFDTNKWIADDRSAFTVTEKRGLTLSVSKEPGVERVIGEIPYSDLSANANDGKYHLYAFKDVTCIAGCTENSVIYLFDWALQNKGMPAKVIHGLNSEPVDLYLSMKIDGDLTGNEKWNLPVYSIDRMILVTSCACYTFDSYVSNNDATCKDGTKSGTCPVCGAYATVTDVGTRKGHQFTNYVSNNNATIDTEGTKTATCDYGCGTTHTLYESGGTLPKELAKLDPSKVFVFSYEEFTGEVYQVEDDPQSVTGKAIVIRAAEQGGQNNNPYRVTPTNPLHIALWSSRETVICDLYGEDLHQDGRYHLYKIEDISVLNEDRYNFIYLFTTWELRSYTLPKILLQNGLKGEKIDFYLSMKIEGDVSCNDRDNMPVYYIDRIIIVKS